MKTSDRDLNSCQAAAIQLLRADANIFLTGCAGSGKSFLIQHFLKEKTAEHFPIVASTGAAALLVGGRTFHSFFGIGIMEGGTGETVHRAVRNPWIVKRLKNVHGVIIDEISMISGTAFECAETIARKARQNDSPWGGMQVIAVGDFTQLPPVTPGKIKDWAFLNPTWSQCEFQSVALKTVMRTQDQEFLEVLNQVRSGHLTDQVTQFLNARISPIPEKFQGTRLFPRKMEVESYNRQRLDEFKGPYKEYPTEYKVKKQEYLEPIKKNAPIPEVLYLKTGALVMLRQNDPDRRWVNGSLGIIKKMGATELKISLLNGLDVDVEPVTFSHLDGDGTEQATARNFPVTVAYATTIHKAQGMTIDQLRVDLRGAWEHGQAYVALSRVKTAAGLSLDGWSPRSMIMDANVAEFFRRESIPI